MNHPRLGKSGIEWLGNQDGSQGYIWSFYSGCLNGIEICQVSPDCWARGIVNRFPDRYPNGFNPTFYPEAFLSPLYLTKPSRVGVGFMGDLFGYWVDPDMEVGLLDSRGDVFARTTLKNMIFTVVNGTLHTYIFLTKCGQNLQKWSPFPDNCQVGISATDVFGFVHAIEYLSKIEAKVKFISMEPLYYWDVKITTSLLTHAKYFGINGLIIGCQTRPYRLPLLAWVKDIVDVATKLEIDVFLKDNLVKFLPDNDLFFVGTRRNRHLRQELP